jgi:hypothetical protein
MLMLLNSICVLSTFTFKSFSIFIKPISLGAIQFPFLVPRVNGVGIQQRFQVVGQFDEILGVLLP